MDGPRDTHIKWSKSDRKKTNILWYHLYVESKKKRIQMNLQNRNGLIDMENKLMVTKRDSRGGYKLEVWD